jgi:hypothetical protein
MAYTDRNFKTKKAFKTAVAAWNEAQKGLFETSPMTIGAILNSKATASVEPVTVYQPGPFGPDVPPNGTVCIEGPHYPEPHRWYATATLQNGVVVKVK